MNVRKLVQLQNHLMEETTKFDYRSWVVNREGCGTIGCVAGTTCLQHLPPDVVLRLYKEDNTLVSVVAAHLLGLTKEEAYWLFMGKGFSKPLSYLNKIDAAIAVSAMIGNCWRDRANFVSWYLQKRKGYSVDGKFIFDVDKVLYKREINTETLDRLNKDSSVSVVREIIDTALQEYSSYLSSL